MNKLFLDTNILLDLTLARQPFDEDAIRFFKQADEGTIEIHASALSFCNIAYILEKSILKNQINQTLSKLSLFVNITYIDSKTIHDALVLNYKDFEDAVQYQSALNTLGLTHFITRNKPDFIETSLPILTPSEYWAL